ncbi:MAG: hypothetical protein ACI8XM_003008 [Haloarculaceae archaeon]|jgi:hypothetical protein
MSQNCSVRSVMELGTRQHGISIAPDWLDEAGVGVGDTIGLNRREGRLTERGATIHLGEYDPDTVDYEKELKDKGGSTVVTLPLGIRMWLNALPGDAEVGTPSVYLSRGADSEDILVEAP